MSQLDQIPFLKRDLRWDTKVGHPKSVPAFSSHLLERLKAGTFQKCPTYVSQLFSQSRTGFCCSWDVLDNTPRAREHGLD